MGDFGTINKMVRDAVREIVPDAIILGALFVAITGAWLWAYIGG